MNGWVQTDCLELNADISVQKSVWFCLAYQRVLVTVAECQLGELFASS